MTKTFLDQFPELDDEMRMAFVRLFGELQDTGDISVKALQKDARRK